MKNIRKINLIILQNSKFSESYGWIRRWSSYIKFRWFLKVIWMISKQPHKSKVCTSTSWPTIVIWEREICKMRWLRILTMKNWSTTLKVQQCNINLLHWDLHFLLLRKQYFKYFQDASEVYDKKLPNSDSNHNYLFLFHTYLITSSPFQHIWRQCK